MTSPCELQIYCQESQKAQSLAKEILEMAKRLEKKYNFYDPHSYLSTLNQRTESRLDPQTKELLRRAKLFYTQTEGIFDITMGTVTEARSLESIEQIEAESRRLYPYVGIAHLHIKKDRLSFDNPYTRIDLGGFVKEYAVDMAVKILKKAKITSAIVNFGGDIYALGHKPNGQAFRIGIKNPLNPSQYLTEYMISDQALTTSASYERSRVVETKSYSHIISPDTLQSEILSVSIIAPTTLEAGVFSTAVMIKPTLKHKYPSLHIDQSLKIDTSPIPQT